jgi:hypothetical protein
VIEVITIGSQVQLIGGPYGRVIGITIRGDGGEFVRYEVRWWTKEGHSLTEWFDDFEVEFDVGSTVKIGFVTGEKK